jgi:predicted nucleic acid-binding protein
VGRTRHSYWDALLLETAAKAGVVACVSEDLRDGSTIGGVEIVSPFAADADRRLATYGLRVGGQPSPPA